MEARRGKGGKADAHFNKIFLTLTSAFCKDTSLRRKFVLVIVYLFLALFTIADSGFLHVIWMILYKAFNLSKFQFSYL